MRTAVTRPFRKTCSHVVLLTAALAGALAAGPVDAAPVYIALGDSITFGETDLQYRLSLGDQGYVALYANTLAAQNGGVRPTVVNLAIDGETATSFMTGAGRTPPVANRTDVPLALENLHYPSASVTQSQLFMSTVRSQVAAGNTIQAITITLGFNDLAALASLAPAQALALVPATLSAYAVAYGAVLAEVRSVAPDAVLTLLGYYNPFPADPTSPAAPIFNAFGLSLNAVIRQLATTYGGRFADTATPFVGHEAAYTYLDDLPSGSSVGGPFGGVLPIGNVHPNALGYSVIAAQVAASGTVPEPATWALVAVGLLMLRSLRRLDAQPFQRTRAATISR